MQTSPNNNFGYVPGGLAGFAYVDANGNGAKDAGEAGIGGVVITGRAAPRRTTAADGSYSFSNLDAGSYNVSAPSTASGKARSTPSPLSVALTAGQNSPNNNFGYIQGGLSGFAYVDANGNGAKDAGEAGIGSVMITGPSGATARPRRTAATASAIWTRAATPCRRLQRRAAKRCSTPSPLNVALTAGQNSPNNNFGYVPGGLSGFAYVDANGNGAKDAGEAGIGSVMITGPSGATATTAADGSYSFSNLDAGSYSCRRLQRRAAKRARHPAR